ncbi:hypothetical protein RND71_019098 [Anisodus tanguticus]|uniref:DUF4283 domain-containing protein n=1 Tax=Anisodus tanguticus TaxID=243964 RepID=A0AAE1VDZ0_9SOLA|nr:hypothetical protein RND71_019098 [Anisodus tanguticus]
MRIGNSKGARTEKPSLNALVETEKVPQLPRHGKSQVAVINETSPLMRIGNSKGTRTEKSAINALGEAEKFPQLPRHGKSQTAGINEIPSPMRTEISNAVRIEKSALNTNPKNGVVLGKTKTTITKETFNASLPNGTRALIAQPKASAVPIKLPEPQPKNTFANKTPKQNTTVSKPIAPSDFPPLPVPTYYQASQHPHLDHDPQPSQPQNDNASTTKAPQHPPNKPKQTYAGITSGSRLEATGMKLQFLEQESEDVELDTEDEVPFVETWGYCLIGCFTGPFPGRNALNSIVKKWGVKCRIIPYGRGWTIFRFMTDEDRVKVFHGGPYMAFGKTLMLKSVDKGVLLNDELFTTIPVWVIFRDIPLSVWSATGLSKIASRVGIPLYTDKFTKERSKMNYARVLIEIDVSKKPIQEFGVKLPDSRRYTQKVEYENYPEFCFHCATFGHNHLKCKKLLPAIDPMNIPRPQHPTKAPKNGGTENNSTIASKSKGPISNPLFTYQSPEKGTAMGTSASPQHLSQIPETVDQAIIWSLPQIVRQCDATELRVEQRQNPATAISRWVPDHERASTGNVRTESNIPLVPVMLGNAPTENGFAGMDICERPAVNSEQRLQSSGNSTTLVANTFNDDWQEVTSKKKNGKAVSKWRGGAHGSSFAVSRRAPSPNRTLILRHPSPPW